MVYCHRCGIGVAEALYCVECQSLQPTTSAPSTDVAILPATSNSLIYDNNFGAQLNDVLGAGASNGASSMHIEFNPYKGLGMDTVYSPDREQCQCCKDWFPNEAGYNRHRKGYPFWCSEHGQCFTSSAIHYHGMEFEHDRCFVQTCPSKYRLETGWTRGQIKEHVKKAHTYSGRAVK